MWWPHESHEYDGRPESRRNLRVRSSYREAGSRTSELTGYGLTLSVARGEQNGTLIAIAFAATWAASLTWLTIEARRPAKP